MPPLKLNSNDAAVTGERCPPETWESLLNEFPGATVKELDIDRALAAFLDEPSKPCPLLADGADAPCVSHLYGIGETDPLLLFQSAGRPAPQPVSAGHAAAGNSPGALMPGCAATGGVSPSQRRAMQAALAACIDAVLAPAVPKNPPPIRAAAGWLPRFGARKYRAALREAQDLRYRQQVKALQNEAGALFNQMFLPVYLWEIANSGGPAYGSEINSGGPAYGSEINAGCPAEGSGFNAGGPAGGD